MKTNSAIFDHCEPVQEIMGSIPSWITRWGVTIIFAVFAMIILGCCLIDYPQTISAPITVILSEQGEITGNMLVPSPGFGKVQIGQTAKVKLDCYPAIEYGMIGGRISKIDTKPKTNSAGHLVYTVGLDFPEGTRSNYRKTLVPLDEMSGTAVIITGDKKMIERLVGPIRHIITN